MRQHHVDERIALPQEVKKRPLRLKTSLLARRVNKISVQCSALVDPVKLSLEVVQIGLAQ